MNNLSFSNSILILLLIIITPEFGTSQNKVAPSEINFVRQAVKRIIFDESQAIPLTELHPEKIIGKGTMYPVNFYTKTKPEIYINEDLLVVKSMQETKAGIWFGGFNPFATYIIELDSLSGHGEVGFEFSDRSKKNQFIVTTEFDGNLLTDVNLMVTKDSNIVVKESIRVNLVPDHELKGKLILQMLGSGLTYYHKNKGLPVVIGQVDFNKYLDLRQKSILQSFQSNLYVHLINGTVSLNAVKSVLSAGVGLSDIRVITYENGDPMIDKGRLWYTMSIRGRALPHHIQGVFSMNPTVFDIRMEGIIVFDRDDGLLRNEIASHIFYDRKSKIWHGLTTGFSAYANIESEKKQLLAIESKNDPRFGFSVMKATKFGMVGDIEDPHILYDNKAGKWRILTCENSNGYKAVMLESDHWNKGYTKIAGPVKYNSTGTSIMKIGGTRYCFSGSSERDIFIYTYPELEELGTLKMDLPPWNSKSGTRVWPNVVELPQGYSFRYIALMMDRLNYPGLNGPNWSYGALYLYHGFE